MLKQHQSTDSAFVVLCPRDHIKIIRWEEGTGTAYEGYECLVYAKGMVD